uniref:Leucine-rich repeat-containing N-terminal plant-type domain-containing protein n=1 Tax=Corethron hystrix TaxID=216773 RepID=A0A7S1B9K6_9STRA|mmetsp:Transcript_18157/g.41347  ORF Transcript_18157/g.41347 Transcript_18157/m.41347 type:complete len:753 (+) Transcript_18157:254-2512(+)
MKIIENIFHLSCQDSLGFHVEIRGKKVDCDVVRFQMPHVTEILCERITQYEYSSHPIKYHCPEACDFDCTKSVSTKVQCADKTEFMVNIRGKDVTCELVSLLDARTQAVLCAHSEYWNGKMQTIDQFCPIACGKNDCAVTTRNAPMKNTTPECLDDEDFMVSIRGKNASCEFVSLASKSIQSILCERLVAWNGKSQTIDKFCPVACGSGCVAVSTQQSTATHKDKCLDNRDFMTNVRGKGVTCEFISSSNTSIRSILCGRSGTWNGKTQTIDKFCPSACRNDCTTKDPMLPPPPAVSRTEIDTRCADDKDFMKSIRGTDITCRFVSLANTSIRSVLCERLETWKGRTQLLSRFCPLACGQGCTAVSSAQVSRIGRQSLTTDPTSGPSHTPSDIPSNNPTTSPTYNPTATPTYPPTVSPTYTPTLTPTFQPTRCAVRTEAERIRALADRYADSSSDITRPAQQKALEFIMQLGEDPCKENSYDLQRYVAVVWYYSTGGENWEDPGNYLNGEDECEWKGLVCEGGDSITRMIFNENNLKGSLPNEIQHLSKLRTLEADGNKLRGIIPEDITECMQLEAIHLENNFLEGTIPNKIGKLQKLKVLDVDKNILSGSLPSSLFDIMSLVILDLDNNYISGVIQPEIRKLINLKQMQLENNLFTGSIPNELGEIESLELIYLHGNDITGTMPQSVCKLQLNDIWANCGNGYPQLLCDCCTRCLDQNYQARGVKEGNKQDFSSFLAFLEGWWDLGLEEEP